MRVLPRGSTSLLKLPPKVSPNTTIVANSKQDASMSAADKAAARSVVAKLSIEILPDEMITHILLYLCTDLRTLCAVAKTSSRLRRLSMDVVRVYFLPNIKLMTVIDQEGRRKNTTQYVFDMLDDATMEARFKPVRTSPQRYRNDNYAASPTLHRLSLSDANDYPTMVSPQPTSTSSLIVEPSAIALKQNAHNVTNNSRRQPSWHTLDSITSNSNNDSSNMTTTLITIETGRQKHLQISKLGPFSACSNSSLWQLEYMVSTDHSALMSAEDTGLERFVTPLFVKAHLSLFKRRQRGQNGATNSKAFLQWFKKKRLPSLPV
ncbi:hypothetical protein BDB00DRAFT_833168 [Zychaea mexicana]|uniref:uncharacterized protein n=1 Tax=Zychaea mexicana TaxID=64656 RepID=UPI0022FEB233|nr:uncharacterized protein BDB00DRAFT_833168 [Zychaea mexicana]KAI9491331.1 hypothetical protein BDB00DRAFT_833168 [Zychaea mexicana]